MNSQNSYKAQQNDRSHEESYQIEVRKSQNQNKNQNSELEKVFVHQMMKDNTEKQKIIDQQHKREVQDKNTQITQLKNALYYKDQELSRCKEEYSEIKQNAIFFSMKNKPFFGEKKYTEQLMDIFKQK